MASNISDKSSTRSNSLEDLAMETENNNAMASGNNIEDSVLMETKSMDEAQPSTSSGAAGGSGIDKLLQQQKNEIMYELRRMKLGDRPVTGQGHKEQVEQFFDRLVQDQNGQSTHSSEQHRPEAVTVEVNALVERRPVSSLLQSARFRTNIESAIRQALTHLSPAQSTNNVSNQNATNRSNQNVTNSPVTARQNGGNNGPSTPPPAPPLPADLDLPPPQQEQAVSLRSQLMREIRRQPQRQRGNMGTPQIPTPAPRASIQAPTPTPRAQTVAPTIPTPVPTPALTERWVQNQTVDDDMVNGQDRMVEYSLEESLQEEFIAEISELVQRQLVTSTLAGNFRNNLEQMMSNRLRDMIANGVQEQHPLSEVPRTQVRHNDFTHLGINVSNQQGSDILDDVSVISATAAVTVPQAQHYATSRELTSIKTELQELRHMMRLSFDLQLDIQRAIRQEVAAAVNNALSHSQAPTVATPPQPTPTVSSTTPSSSRPISETSCLICIDQSVDSVLYRCGHMCVCYRCGLDLRSRNAHCPVCRAPISDIIRAYRSNDE